MRPSSGGVLLRAGGRARTTATTSAASFVSSGGGGAGRRGRRSRREASVRCVLGKCVLRAPESTSTRSYGSGWTTTPGTCVAPRLCGDDGWGRRSSAARTGSCWNLFPAPTDGRLGMSGRSVLRARASDGREGRASPGAGERCRIRSSGRDERRFLRFALLGPVWREGERGSGGERVGNRRSWQRGKRGRMPKTATAVAATSGEGGGGWCEFFFRRLGPPGLRAAMIPTTAGRTFESGRAVFQARPNRQSLGRPWRRQPTEAGLVVRARYAAMGAVTRERRRRMGQRMDDGSIGTW